MAQDSTEGAAPVRPAKGERAAYSANAIHMVRTVTTANITLSQMADQKASVLMGANFVVFTISVGQVHDGQIPLTLAILALFAFASALCTITALIPAIKSRKPEAPDQNILFFGVFAGLPEQEFADRVIASLEDDETLFRTMLRDIHQNGTVLARKKYRFLRIAYLLFLVGLSATFAIFLLELSGAVKLPVWSGIVLL